MFDYFLTSSLENVVPGVILQIFQKIIMETNFRPPTFSSFDDLLHATYSKLLNQDTLIEGKRGQFRELLNFSATLLNPRSRVSHSLDRRLVRSKFAEFAWYLSKSADIEFIDPYIKAYSSEDSENHKILGAYGPKIFDAKRGQISQFMRVIKQILTRESTKQAYLVISDSSDYKVRTQKFSSPPCTIGLHFMVRSGSLHLTVYMRSNDAYLGLPHDLFSFSMLQEIIAIMTETNIGTYTHICTSLHVYENQIEKMHHYVEEGYQEVIEMPPMKFCSPETLQEVSLAFNNSIDDYQPQTLDDYWGDFVLFADRYFQNSKLEDWLSQFKINEFSQIATNSIYK